MENSGHFKQAVPSDCPSSGLYVPGVQDTTSPAVHHLPLGHVNGEICVTDALTGEVEAVTVAGVPSAEAIAELSVASSTFCTRSSSAAGSSGDSGVPFTAVPVVAMVRVTLRVASTRERRRSEAHGFDSVRSPSWTS